MTDEFDDTDGRNLLRLLHKYVREFAPDIPQTISALAEDLAMSMDRTRVEDEQLYLDIVQTIGVT